MASTWKAFVINKTDKDYTIIAENDRKYHTLPLPIQEGVVRLSSGTIVDIQETIFSPHQLFMACKNYQYDIIRKRNQYKKRVAKKEEQATTAENPFFT